MYEILGSSHLMVSLLIDAHHQSRCGSDANLRRPHKRWLDKASIAARRLRRNVFKSGAPSAEPNMSVARCGKSSVACLRRNFDKGERLDDCRNGYPGGAALSASTDKKLNTEIVPEAVQPAGGESPSNQPSLDLS
jgi:hypothetical protein